MRVVLDTNVLVSALIKAGKPRKLFDAAVVGRHRLVTSRSLIEELVRVLEDERIRRYVTTQETTAFLRLLAATASTVDTRSKFSVLNSPDDMVLQTAYDGQADLIVTGDEHLLDLVSFRGIRIVTVSDAQALLV